MRKLALIQILSTVLAAAPAATAGAGERGLLWRVVQACLANHDLTGAAFPCLEVDVATGRSRGVAVLRAPFEASHIIVTPTVPVSGVEAEALRSAEAPPIFAQAWSARRFVDDALPRRPGREDVAMAVNSRPGRSQDQLHIHVDCLRPDIRASLDRQTGQLREGRWTVLALSPRAPRYSATLLDETAFAGANVFALAKAGLDIPAPEMDGLTIAVVPVVAGGHPAFAVLARRRIPHSRDEAHGEALLDHNCSILR